MNSKRYLLAGAMFLAGCGQKEVSDKKQLMLGVNVDLTGSIATPSWRDAMQMAKEHANKALTNAGVEDVEFENIISDSTNTPSVIVANSIEMASQGAKALLGDSSSNFVAIGLLNYDPDTSKHLDLPVISFAATSPDINNPNVNNADAVRQATLRDAKDWLFRCTLSDKYQAPATAQLAASFGNHGDTNGDGLLKVSIYATDETYGIGTATAYKNALLALQPQLQPHNVRVVVEQVMVAQNVDPNSYNWDADLAKVVDNLTDGVADGVPDVVMDPLIGHLGTYPMKAWSTGNYSARYPNMQFVHSHGLRTQTTLRSLGSLAEGMTGLSQAVIDGPSGEMFAKDLKATTGQDPVFRDAVAYDAAMNAMLAMFHAYRANGLSDPADLTGAMVRDSIRKVNDASAGTAGKFISGVDGLTAGMKRIVGKEAINYEGASGPTDFDANGDILSKQAQWKVQGGAFIDVAKYDCVKDASCPRAQ